MSNEQVTELFDMVFAIPKSSHYYVKLEYYNEDDNVSFFVAGKKRCECCGRLEDVNEFKIPDSYDEAKEFIEKWNDIITKEDENGYQNSHARRHQIRGRSRFSEHRQDQPNLQSILTLKREKLLWRSFHSH